MGWGRQVDCINSSTELIPISSSLKEQKSKLILGGVGGLQPRILSGVLTTQSANHHHPHPHHLFPCWHGTDSLTGADKLERAEPGSNCLFLAKLLQLDGFRTADHIRMYWVFFFRFMWHQHMIYETEQHQTMGYKTTEPSACNWLDDRIRRGSGKRAFGSQVQILPKVHFGFQPLTRP